jgi:hypothetical protein
MGVPKDEFERLQSNEQFRGLTLQIFTVKLTDVVVNLSFRHQKDPEGYRALGEST